MAIRVTEAKKGMVIRWENELYQITRYEHVTPGNWRAINHLYLKNLKTGRQKEVRMNSGDMIDPVFLEKKTCQYLYKDSTGYVFMDNESYEQFIERIAPNSLAVRVKLADLEDNMDLRRGGRLLADDLERVARYQRAWRRLTTGVV